VDELSDSELVGRISNSLIGDINSPGNPHATPEMQLFFDIFCLDMEIGSGGSFEQYFRWSSKEQVERIVAQLEEADLNAIIESTQKAIDTAFPKGPPEDQNKYEECTDWSDEQEGKLYDLYEREKSIHTLIEEKLAKYARDNSLLSQI
jgi:hypothetical protein